MKFLLSIPDSWRGYRRRHLIAALSLVVGLPLVFMLALAVNLLLGVTSEFLFLGAIVLWCAAWGFAAIRVSRWPCPRCGQPWLGNQEVRLGASRTCANCGLGLYEAP